MKKIINSLKIATLAVAGLFFVNTNASAQAVDNMYFNIDWQFNGAVGNSFARNASGYGMNADAGYFLTNNFAVGLFLSYSSNNKYVDRRTLDLGNGSSVTSDQQHHLFQLPFGATARYTFMRGTKFQPYAAAKLGTQYSEAYSQMNTFRITDKQWGFYMSPEVGISTYLDPQQQVGVHFAVYYSYGTNKSKVLNYKIDGLENIGFRLGVSF